MPKTYQYISVIDIEAKMCEKLYNQIIKLTFPPDNQRNIGNCEHQV